MSKIKSKKEQVANKQAVLVLGMHRSGTSVISKALNVLGCYAGDNLMPPSQDNEKGYWEDMDVIAFNDSLLAQYQSSWDLLLASLSEGCSDILLASVKQKARSLIKDKFISKSRIVIKDPRISMLLPFWQEQLESQGFQVKVILCLRHPRAVADSLNRRDKFSDNKSFQLWREYNIAVLEAVKENVLVVDCDRLMTSAEDEVSRIADFLGLDDSIFQSPEVRVSIKEYSEEFIDSSLLHYKFEVESFDERVPEYIQVLYQKLSESIDAPPLNSEACKKIVASIVDRDCSIFGDQKLMLVDELRDRIAALDKAVLATEAATSKVQEAENIRNLTAEINLSLNESNILLKEKVHELNVLIEQKANDLIERETELKELIFTDKEKYISEIETNRVEFLDVLTNKDAQLHAYQQQIDALIDTVSVIRSSTSWRITFPIRSVVGLLEKIKRVSLSLWRRVQDRGLRSSVRSIRRIYHAEGWRGIKSRILLGERSQPSRMEEGLHIKAAAASTFDLPVSIVRNKDGDYSLENVQGGYTYIPLRKPDNFESSIALMKSMPLFSILVPTYNTSLDLLEKMIASVELQWYSNWQLILVDDASPSQETRDYLAQIEHPAIKVLLLAKNQGIAGATNAGLECAEGEFVVLLDHDDELTADCLYELAQSIEKEPLDFIYSDEDKISAEGLYVEPHFKPDWSPDTMMSTMYTCHVACFRRSLLEEVGGLRSEYDGCQDWDLVLRVTEKTDRIYHIPKVLYHWRIIPESTASDIAAKPYILEATQRVRLDAINRRGLKGSVEAVNQVPGYFRVKYQLQNDPLISIIIPTRDNTSVLTACINSIFDKTAYQNFEIIIVDNGSVDPETLKYFEKIKNKLRVIVIRHDAPFNYSELNNLGAKRAAGEIYLFLNDDTEVISPDWLELLGGYAQLPHSGAIGAKLLYPGGNNVQHAGVLNLETGPRHAFLNLDSNTPGYYMRNLLEYNWLAVTGACLMLDAEKFNKVGGFDESFPIAYNDVDLCMRLCDAGLYNTVCQSVRLTHHESVSRGYDNVDPEKNKRLQKDLNRLYRIHPQYFQRDPFFSPNLHPEGANFEIQQ